MKNIFLKDSCKSFNYKYRGGIPKSSSYPIENKLSHVEKIQSNYENAINAAIAIKIKENSNLEGYYLDFYSYPSFELANLENRKEKIKLLNIQENEENISKATIYVPQEKKDYFSNKFSSYKETINNEKINNENLVNSIENIKNATLESFWTSKIDQIPAKVKTWCELWIDSFLEKDSFDNLSKKIKNILKELDIPYKENFIQFPERTVFLIYVNRELLDKLIKNCPNIAEIQKSAEPNLFYNSLSMNDQLDFEKDFKKRLTINEKSNISVCLLDTGINTDHLLLSDAILSAQTVIENTVPRDIQGHGSEMAGIILFNDLNNLLSSSDEFFLNHKIESEKILPKDTSNLPNLYGYITEQAVYDAEIKNPSQKRIICMAVTSPNNTKDNGQPSSWSSNIDKIIFNKEDVENKRCFLVSAGNVSETEYIDMTYPEPNIIHSVEDPAQAWNAISIGAYSGKDIVNYSDATDDPSFKNFHALVEKDNLSPYSSTSKLWNKWPIKPEVLFDGGNMCTNGADYSSSPNLSLLTTSKSFSKLSNIWGTSSATAQASFFIAKLYEQYPDIWPETARALLIHSAEWTTKMKKTFLTDNKSKSKLNLLRTCGYGIPNLEKALECKNNSVNLIIEDKIKPFKLNQNKTNVTYNEMRVVNLPWPTELLEQLENTNVKIKLTLSYFIEPSPSIRGANNKYSYASYGLRFDLKRPMESDDDFFKRVDYAMKNENDSDSRITNSSVPNWFLGKNNQKNGSIHSDFIETTAIQLSNMNKIAIYPVNGWWKTRKILKRYDNEVRYSLIVTIETPKTNVDLYTPIMTKIEIPTEIEI